MTNTYSSAAFLPMIKKLMEVQGQKQETNTPATAASGTDDDAAFKQFLAQLAGK